MKRGVKRAKRKHWSLKIGKYIADEATANRTRRKKRPWKQVVAIGLARARKAGITVPTGEGRGKRLAAGGRRQAHG